MKPLHHRSACPCATAVGGFGRCTCPPITSFGDVADAVEEVRVAHAALCKARARVNRSKLPASISAAVIEADKAERIYVAAARKRDALVARAHRFER